MNTQTVTAYLVAALFALLYVRSVAKVIRWRKKAELWNAAAIKAGFCAVLAGVAAWRMARRADDLAEGDCDNE